MFITLNTFKFTSTINFNQCEVTKHRLQQHNEEKAGNKPQRVSVLSLAGVFLWMLYFVSFFTLELLACFVVTL